VQLRTLGSFAASIGVWIGSTTAGEPAKPLFALKTEQSKATSDPAANKQLVDAISAKLRASDAASDTDIEYSAHGGAVTITGTVANAGQKQSILEIVRRVDGVKVVKDGLKVNAAKPTPAPQFTVAPVDEPIKVPDLTKEVEVVKVPDLTKEVEVVKVPDLTKEVEVVKATEPVMKPVETAKAIEPVMKPVDLKTTNQKLAMTVMTQLRATGAAVSSDLDILANNGTVSVMGTTGSEQQKMAILEVVRRVEGVKVVKDGVQLKATPRPMNNNIMPVQAVGPYAMQAPSAMPPAPMMAGNPQIDPVPVGPGGGLDGAAPPLPQNAWPTYAPYNNVSRVAYPTAYPYNAFPFIGPYYPFPKVPLGWRKVTLEWEDGHWWLGRKQAPIDYWRVKFGY